ncbi:MAG TPA: XdhC/CoxI family protein [Acidimicrobiia bacterium]|jgi:xanthine dehydrogenase accessory factor|nr:XdhC/CoxI family protein [Acidimicrobiia bacterium]
MDVLGIARDLAERGERFALATVVWRRAPSSGQTGYRAIITAGGEVRGWVGGACAEPVVVREALAALEAGAPRLVFLGKPEELAGAAGDDTVLVPMSCQSEGALKIFIEPLPRGPDLVIVGRSPMVRTLAAMAKALGWWTTVVDDGGQAEDWTEPDRVVTKLDLEMAGVGARTALVIATQGHYDEQALEQAILSPAGWIGVVASRRRAERLLDNLEDRERIHAPAGLDLGHVTHEEIAVAILAELVQFRAASRVADEIQEEKGHGDSSRERVHSSCVH